MPDSGGYLGAEVCLTDHQPCLALVLWGSGGETALANSQPRASPVKPNKRGCQGAWRPGPGRPKKDQAELRRNQKVRLLGQKRLRVDFSFLQKHRLCLQMAQKLQSGMSRKRIFKEMAVEQGCSAGTAKAVFRQSERWAHMNAAHEIKGKKRGQHVTSFACEGRPAKYNTGKVPPQRRLAGKRGYLGPLDFLRAERLAVRFWAEHEEELGHSLGRRDLLRQFMKLTKVRVDELAGKIADGQELLKQERDCLSFCQGRLEKWSESQFAKDRTAKALLRQLGWRERQTTRVTAMSPEEEQRRMEDSWRLFDFVVSMVGGGDLQQLQHWVANPAFFAGDRRSTALLFTDQVPVWLMVQAGTQIVSEAKLANVRNHKRLRTAVAKAVSAADDAGLAVAACDLDEAEALSALTRGPGSTDAARWRITFICRQAVEDYWQPLLAPRGKILPSILLTYGVYCRLENISGDGKWLSAAAR